jgi:hypothetical protein
VSREGPKWLGQRLFNNREAELQARVDRRRVRIATLAPGDLRGSIAAYDDFVRELEELAAPVRHPDAEPDTSCEAVPLAGEPD